MGEKAMKKTYNSPKSELTIFTAEENLATSWNALIGNLYKADSGTLDNPSAMDFTLPDNPEGNF